MNNIHRESVLTAELHLMAEMVQRARMEASKLQADRDALLAALKEAVEDIEAWAGYVSEYFQHKHDLQGTLEKHRAAIAAAEGKT